MTSNRTNRPAFILFAVLCLLVTSCGTVRGERVVAGVSTQDTPQGQSSPIVRAPGNEIVVNTVGESGAFSFVATELGGASAISGSEIVADGPVMMTFVVPQCPICVSEGPRLARSAEENTDITYVMVHSGGTATEYRQFIDSSGLELDNVVHLDDSAGLLWARFGVIQQPTNVFIDSAGYVSQSLGALSTEDLELVANDLRGGSALTS